MRGRPQHLPPQTLAAREESLVVGFLMQCLYVQALWQALRFWLTLCMLSCAPSRHAGWPLSPAQQPMCTICPAGWAATSGEQCTRRPLLRLMAASCSTVALKWRPDKLCVALPTCAVNSTACQMCPPGTYAPWVGILGLLHRCECLVVGQPRRCLLACCAPLNRLQPASAAACSSSICTTLVDLSGLPPLCCSPSQLPASPAHPASLPTLGALPTARTASWGRTRPKASCAQSGMGGAAGLRRAPPAWRCLPARPVRLPHPTTLLPCSPVPVPRPAARSSLCLACPNGTSTIDDGSSSCSPSLPVNYSAPRQGGPALWAFAGCHRCLMQSIRSALTHVPARPIVIPAQHSCAPHLPATSQLAGPALPLLPPPGLPAGMPWW